MQIKLAENDEAIARCYPVMSQLRPHLSEQDFIASVRRQSHEGYRLLFAESDGEIRALAGFRVMEMLAHGRFLYVDDLITDAAARSQGYGAALLDWLAEHAAAKNCARLHLDSGVQRADAHRFYFRQRLKIAAYHFSASLSELKARPQQ